VEAEVQPSDHDVSAPLHTEHLAQELVTLAKHLLPRARIYEVVIEIVPRHKLAFATHRLQARSHAL
jgi:hypothetical protein